MQTLSNMLEQYPRLAGELARRYRNHKWERVAPNSVRFPGAGVVITGHGEMFANRGGVELEQNLLTAQGIDYLFSVGLNDGTKVTEWYVAPFLANVTPTDTLTASSFDTLQTEFIAYDESTRPALVEVPGSKSIGNAASPALITISTNSSTVWGAGILGAPGKRATTSILLAAIKAGAARSGLLDGDTLGFIYVLSGADDGV